jgi:serine protease Do
MAALSILSAPAGADDDASAALARVLAELRQRVGKSVVALEVARDSDPQGTGRAGAVAAHRDYLNRPAGPCSGVIYEPDGFIVTSYFNVSGVLKKNGIKVTLHDGTEHRGELLGFDERRDIALVKIDAAGLPALPRAAPEEIVQGAFAAALGRAPDPAAPTINVGIVSAVNRMKNAAVQTDAEMNYGNTGGALVTLKGALIGVCCNIKPDAHWGQSGGIGFACKASEIDKLLPRLKKGEKIDPELRPHLGIRVGEGNPEVQGVHVAQVEKDGPAEKAGMKDGDVIVELDGRKIEDFEELREALLAKKVGDEVTLKVKRPRGPKEFEDKALKAKLDGRPDE